MRVGGLHSASSAAKDAGAARARVTCDFFLPADWLNPAPPI